jgi:peptide/nickel transport system ATP-binding protein
MCDNVAVMYAGEVIEYGSAEAIFEGSAHHPYTLGLFGSVPDIDARESRLRPIDGLMSDPSNLPEGCRFAPRCPVAKDFCHETNPSFHVNGRHMIRCHRLTEAWHEGGEN